MSEATKPAAISVQWRASVDAYRELTAGRRAAQDAIAGRTQSEITEEALEIEFRAARAEAERDSVRRLVDAALSHASFSDMQELMVSAPPTVPKVAAEVALAQLEQKLRSRIRDVLPELSSNDIEVRPLDNDAGGEATRDDDAWPEEGADPVEMLPTGHLRGEAAEAGSDVPLPQDDGADGYCPACGAAVAEEDRECPHCHEELPPSALLADALSLKAALERATHGRPRRKGWRPLGFSIFAVLAGLSLLVIWLNARPADLVPLRFFCGVPGINRALPCSSLALTPSSSRPPPRVFGEDLTRRLEGLRDGGNLDLEPGTYNVTSPIALLGTITIRGVGKDATVLRLSGSGPGIEYSGGGTLSLSDLAIQRGPDTTGNVLTISSGSVRISNVEVSGGRAGGLLSGAGIAFQGTSSGIVKSCTSTQNDFGLVVAQAATPTIDSCDISENYGPGVSYYFNSGGSLVDNVIARNGYALRRNDYSPGVALEYNSNPDIVGNTVEHNAGIGIQYRDTAGGRVADNRIIENGANIARYAGSEASAGGIVIGVRGTQQQPRPNIESNNTYSGNYGGGRVDYR